MATKIRPLHNRVIVKRTEEVEKTKAGIIIPDTAKEKPQEGKVVAAGPGRLKAGKIIPLDVRAETGYFSGSISVQKLNSTAKTISSCGKMTSSESLKNKEVRNHGCERDTF